MWALNDRIIILIKILQKCVNVFHIDSAKPQFYDNVLKATEKSSQLRRSFFMSIYQSSFVDQDLKSKYHYKRETFFCQNEQLWQPHFKHRRKIYSSSIVRDRGNSTFLYFQKASEKL